MNTSQLRQADAPGFLALPDTDQQIEGKVVHPAGQQESRRAEQLRHLGQAAETALRLRPVHTDQGRVERTNGQGDGQRGQAWRGKPQRHQGQAEPAGKGGRPGHGEQRFEGHADPLSGQCLDNGGEGID